MEKIDVILTSYKRWDLLAQTIASFFKFNTYPIASFFIYEDYGYKRMDDNDRATLDALKDRFPMITWIIGNDRVGQIRALDVLVNEVSSRYYFSIEDDWEFFNEGFIKDSIAVLDKYPKCIQVWLRELNDTNGHPVIMGEEFNTLSRNYKNTWHGFSFNPSVRRISDYHLIKSYQKHASFNPRKPWESEVAIGKLYMRLGYFAAIFNNGYVRHIGNQHGIRS